MEILFNKAGDPLMFDSSVMRIENEGLPSNYDEKRKELLSTYSLGDVRTTPYGGEEWVDWGADNDFPRFAANVIAKTSVLNTGLRFLHRVLVGNGLQAVKVVGVKEDGTELYELVQDERVNEIVNSRNTRRYLEEASRDYTKFGNACVEFVPNATFTDIAGLHVINAVNRRYSIPDSMGGCKVAVSNSWPACPGSQKNDKPAIREVLQDFDPEEDYKRRKLLGKNKKSLCMRILDKWSQDDVYSEPIWLSAYILGWVDIAHLVPSFLRKAYKNQITWKWHVQIPYSYWEKKYPLENYESVEARKADIQKFMNSVERNLCGAENAEKPLFTNYAINEMNGRIEEEWKITSLDNKYKGGENLVTSAAANSEILFALCINPNVLGAMPSGSYGSNQGGSNIREAYVVNIAQAWLDRSALLDPLYIRLHAAGVSKDVKLVYKNIILTTLDTGSGAKKTVA